MRLINSLPKLMCVATCFVYSVPVILSLILHGSALVPREWLKRGDVDIFVVLYSLALFWFFCFIFLITPGVIIRKPVCNSVFSSSYRKILLILYIIIGYACLFYIGNKTDFYSSVIGDPILTLLSFGGVLIREKLLLHSFLLFTAFIAYSILDKSDSVFFRLTVYFLCFLVIVFLFFTGRRENVLLVIAMMFFAKKNRVSLVEYISLFIFGLSIIIVVLSLRLSVINTGDNFGLDAEELSPLAVSAYIVEHNDTDISKSLEGSTVLRLIFPERSKSISAWYMYYVEGNESEQAGPVVGLIGSSHLFGYVLPFIQVIVFAFFCHSISKSYHLYRTPPVRVLEVFLAFKTFNLFRNGEFPIVSLDVIMFFCIVYPAILVGYKCTNLVPKSDGL